MDRYLKQEERLTIIVNDQQKKVDLFKKVDTSKLTKEEQERFQIIIDNEESVLFNHKKSLEDVKAYNASR